MTTIAASQVSDVFLVWLAGLNFDVAAVLVILPAVILAMVSTVVMRSVLIISTSSQSSVGVSKISITAEIFAALLGFIVVVGFSDFRATERVVLKEAAAVERVLERAEAMGELGAGVAIASRAYAAAVAGREWQELSVARIPVKPPAALAAMRAAIGGLGDTAADQGELKDLANTIEQLRIDRITAVPSSTVAGVLTWIFALGIGATVIVGWFLRGPSLAVHAVLAGGLAGVMVALLILSMQFLYPFSGPVAISNAPFVAIGQAAIP